jgi:hypothetical protein
MSVGQMYLGLMFVNQMSVSLMSVSLMSVSLMSVCLMSVGPMSVGLMSVGHMFFDHKTWSLFNDEHGNDHLLAETSSEHTILLTFFYSSLSVQENKLVCFYTLNIFKFF